MSDKEIKSVALSIRKNGKEIARDKSKTTAFLKKLGILTKAGNVSNAYKEICIPIGQD
ncbi:hypothetical protein [Mucilaginibacter pedocola]|uniref:hypothetical protein n=1 Tax=Mucilaginibacter pedocola TaxID=1792845 RepID=UPI0012DE4001|nr:hypothetical protein [Mucilaginibacter pedocola]